MTIDKSALPDSERIVFNASKVNIVDTTPFVKPKFVAYSDSEEPFDEPTHSDFIKETRNYLTNLITCTGDGNNVDTIHTNHVIMTYTCSGLKTVPFVGIIPFVTGYQETFTATIKGNIEIENENGQVLNKAEFSTVGTAKENTVGDKEIFRGINNAATAALSQLPEELKKQANRYLHEYLETQKLQQPSQL